MKRLIARLWRGIRGPMQWRLLYLSQAKFMAGVTGVVRDREGNVLLLRHRFWPEHRQWGLPTGSAKRGETFEQTVAREVREETGLEVSVGELVQLRSGFRLRIEIAYAARYAGGGTMRLHSMEILEARWCAPGDLPEGLLESHRLLIESSGGRRGRGGEGGIQVRGVVEPAQDPPGLGQYQV
ncbi:NUDIX domain-containing protein [Nonomuraea jiangxiensis]|uniref:ADP-ribose pyrophosphatase YjhB, NUDIX family n=1 Tax=Nonomuraea jiangxiensis TaxID=633440 RepID=A0A1G8I2W4_9ACTN|nr:NUDIX domain-containing protein [Nonomuraea jiangxiensis]SDI13223.1 ADP-ribose pyrophosphatase YjhB, NUDIX family [Nonomuraea jiangxiensis]